MSEVVVQITLDSSGAVTGARKASRAVTEVGREAKSAERSFGSLASKMRAAFAFIFAGTLARALKNLAQQAFELGTTVEETASKFEAVFGSATRRVDEGLREWINTAGLTQTEGREVIATMAAVAQGMGMTKDASAEFADQALRLAADLQAFNNVPIERTSLAVRAAFTGNREALKSLGIAILETEVQERALLETGKTHVNQLTQEERAIATLNLMYQKAGAAVGALEREKDALATQARRASAEFREMREELSQALLPTFGYALSLINDLIRGVDGARAAFVRFVAEGVFEATVRLAEFVIQTGRASRGLLNIAQAVGLFSGADGLGGLFSHMIKGWTDDLRGFRAWTDAAAIGLREFQAAYRDLRADIQEGLGLADAANENRKAAQAARDEAQRLREEHVAGIRAEARRAITTAQWREELEKLLEGLEALEGIDGPGGLSPEDLGLTEEEVAKLAKQRRDAQFLLREIEVDAMEGGTEKVLAQINLEFDRRIALVRERYGDLSQEVKDALERQRNAALALATAGDDLDLPEVKLPPLKLQYEPIAPDVMQDAENVRVILEADLVNSIEQADRALGTLQAAFEKADTQQQRDEIGALIQKLRELKGEMEGVADTARDLGPALQNALAESITSMAASLGELVAGVAESGNVGEALLRTIAQLAQQVGRMMIAFGVSALALRKLLTNPIAAIAAGAALVALGAAAEAAIGSEVERATGSAGRTAPSPSPLTAGIALAQNTPRPERPAPPFMVHNENRVVVESQIEAVDGFVIRSKVREADRAMAAGTGRAG